MTKTEEVLLRAFDHAVRARAIVYDKHGPNSYEFVLADGAVKAAKDKYFKERKDSTDGT